MTEVENKFSSKTRNKYLIIISVIILINIIGFTFYIKSTDVEGDTMSFDFLISSFIFLVIIPLIAFLIGLLIALFPYKNLTYKKKYWRAGLICLPILNIFITIMLIFVSITNSDESIESISLNSNNAISVVGVWQPLKLTYPQGFKNENDIKSLIEMAFESSKAVLWNLHANGSLTLESDKEIDGLKETKGTYSVADKKITMLYSNRSETFEIIKLTNEEMQLLVIAKEGNMKDFITTYKKIRSE